MKTLEDVKRAAEAVEMRDCLRSLIDRARGEHIGDQKAFGVPLSIKVAERLRGLVVDDLLRRLAETDTALRELGLSLPGDPAPGVEPSPKLGLISPKSWDPVTGTFDVWVPGTQAQSWRSGEQVYQVLRPQGLTWDERVEVVDATDPNADWWECGTVVGCLASDDGVMIRVRLDPYNGLMRGAVASGRISRHVGIGYDFLEQEAVGYAEGRPLVHVHRWRLREIRFHRDDVQAEAP